MPCAFSGTPPPPEGARTGQRAEPDNTKRLSNGPCDWPAGRWGRGRGDCGGSVWNRPPVSTQTAETPTYQTAFWFFCFFFQQATQRRTQAPPPAPPPSPGTEDGGRYSSRGRKRFQTKLKTMAKTKGRRRHFYQEGRTRKLRRRTFAPKHKCSC